ncbi:putative peptidase family-domain-containing protein [Microdochium trichocladiopsis]|uniref:Peptidase family-domain-containing protein n=1 Tax=Microdochium trichocladiopsis TaxID=1682393 RepID=A0A9P8YKA9_9PEZI|nr:putative peptidase family-domain-containing protein [Microdochium trichocladiopsis]KAH7040584.1 putative peptidase family-domain-containing protein [Microdochium trichocladiopsis]
MRFSFANSFTALLALGSSVAEAGSFRNKREQAVTVTQTVTATSSEPTAWQWDAGATREVPIHPSCNATERAQLKRGFADAMKYAQHAKDHILRFGNSSDHYVKYFGSAPTAEAAGWYDKIVNGDKTGLWFRCDDIDGNCSQDGWAGHWRGSNATMETVICPLSFTTRKPIEALCAFGYDVANGKLNTQFGIDLIHRLFHVPTIGEGAAEHYADTYAECLQLAIDNPAEAVRNTHSLQYFALDVYAYDIALPGEGCAGVLKEEASSTGAAPAVPSATATEAPSQTSAAPTECHTHADGVVHCS